MIALIFVLFVMYTLACIADGPDVKPRWKSWLGNRLLMMAQRYIRFVPCCSPLVCQYVKDLRVTESMYKKMYEQLRAHLERVVATDPGSLMVIRCKLAISESELMDMYLHSQYYGGMSFEREKDLAILKAKDVCKNKLFENLSRSLTFNVEKDPETLGINVIASIVVNRYAYGD